MNDIPDCPYCGCPDLKVEDNLIKCTDEDCALSIGWYTLEDWKALKKNFEDFKRLDDFFKRPHIDKDDGEDNVIPFNGEGPPNE